MRVVILLLVLALAGCSGTETTLDLSEWDCTKRETRTYLQPMVVGKVTMMMPHTSNVCVRYDRAP